MRTILWQLWDDPAYFAAAIRGCIAFLGACIASGILPTEGQWWKLGLFITAASHFIPAGESNPTPTRVAQEAGRAATKVVGDTLQVVSQVAAEKLDEASKK